MTPEHDVTALVLERVGELRDDLRDGFREVRTDIAGVRAAQQSHGTAIASLEARFNEHRLHCDARFDGHAQRIRDLGAIVDGQEISQVRSIASIEERRRIGAGVKWAVGVAVALAAAAMGILANVL